MKNLKFVDFEENKYFYRVLKEEDGIYKGIVRVGQEDGLIKEGKGNKQYKDGRFFKENEKKIKEKELNDMQMKFLIRASLKRVYIMEKEFLNLQLELFMKASLKIIYMKEKEFLHMKMGVIMKEIEKVVIKKEKEFLNLQMEKFM